MKKSVFNTNFKRLVILLIVSAIYILFTSTIYIDREERRIGDMLLDYGLRIAKLKNKTLKIDNTIIEREKELSQVENIELADKLKGKILLQVEAEGSAWYLYPQDLKRYYLGRPDEVMKTVAALSVEMSVEEIVDYVYFEKALPAEYAGTFLRSTGTDEVFYYVTSDNRLAVLLGTPLQAMNLFTENGIGVSNENIRTIKVGEVNNN